MQPVHSTTTYSCSCKLVTSFAHLSVARNFFLQSFSAPIPSKSLLAPPPTFFERALTPQLEQLSPDSRLRSLGGANDSSRNQHRCRVSDRTSVTITPFKVHTANFVRANTYTRLRGNFCGEL